MKFILFVTTILLAASQVSAQNMKRAVLVDFGVSVEGKSLIYLVNKEDTEVKVEEYLQRSCSLYDVMTRGDYADSKWNGDGIFILTLDVETDADGNLLSYEVVEGELINRQVSPFESPLTPFYSVSHCVGEMAISVKRQWRNL
tara:strand:+ start:30171 stop:30599 length:429 start_codon:yes stop_codon:yes gene_type:complete